MDEMINKLSDVTLEELGGEDYQTFRAEASAMREEDIDDMADTTSRVCRQVADKWRGILADKDHPFWMEKYTL
jgi:hypothetical protein